MDDLNKERIGFNIEIIKLLTLLFITTGGGSLALVAVGLDTLREEILAFWGMIFAFACGIMGIYMYKNTLKKLR